MPHFMSIVCVSVLMATAIFAESDAKLPPIQVVSGAIPAASVFTVATRQQPLVIHSEKEAAQYFPADALKALTKQVDFEQQLVLVFAWRGSGQDRLSFDVAESYPEQVSFRYAPGRTRDLRPHLYTFAIRLNVKWSAPN